MTASLSAGHDVADCRNPPVTAPVRLYAAQIGLEQEMAGAWISGPLIGTSIIETTGNPETDPDYK